MIGIRKLIGFTVFWFFVVLVTFGFGLIPLCILLFFAFSGADKRATKAVEKIKETMMDGESFAEVTLQHRTFALMNRRTAVGITNSRIIIVRRGIFGGFNMSDIQWKDLEDAKIEENVIASLFGSNIAFDHSNARVGKMVVYGIPSAVAGAIYRRSQFEEQAWEEKRRLRGIEEVRAASGGITVNTGQPSTQNGSIRQSSTSILAEIQKAKELLDTGAISDAEFQEMKAHILRNAV